MAYEWDKEVSKSITLSLNYSRIFFLFCLYKLIRSGWRAWSLLWLSQGASLHLLSEIVITRKHLI